jgi:hypothetical protein
MKKVINSILFAFILLPLTLLVSSCGSSSGSDKIFTPEILYRSPDLDFTKVQALAIMPVNCYSDEVPEITGLVNDGLPEQLKSTQKAWKIYSYDEVLRKVNDAGLGRGYQNYIADLNTYVTVAGSTPNFTKETQTFFDQLKSDMNFQALLLTSYGFSEYTVQKKNFLGGMVQATEKTLSVSVMVYDLDSHRTWWVAKLSLKSSEDFSNAQLAQKVLEGIANNFGKGQLRQL